MNRIKLSRDLSLSNRLPLPKTDTLTFFFRIKIRSAEPLDINHFANMKLIGNIKEKKMVAVSEFK